MSPIQIKYALAFAATPEPEQFFSPAMWGRRHSWVGWLRQEGLIDAEDKATEKLHAYVQALCAVPLPVQVWVIPEDGE